MVSWFGCYVGRRSHIELKVKKELNNKKQSEEINNLLKNNDTRGVWNYINKVAGRKNRVYGPEKEVWEEYLKRNEGSEKAVQCLI